jgi:hypothetical protein
MHIRQFSEDPEDVSLIVKITEDICETGRGNSTWIVWWELVAEKTSQRSKFLDEGNGLVRDTVRCAQ